jgi:CrcB protein
MSVVLGVLVGGAIGSLSRYGLDSWVERNTVSDFPWGTFAVNVTGCLVVGFVIAALVDRHQAPAWLRAALVVGFCGGFTTFSTFSQETVDLLEAKLTMLAVANVSASVVTAILAVLLGAAIGRRV